MLGPIIQQKNVLTSIKGRYSLVTQCHSHSHTQPKKPTNASSITQPKNQRQREYIESLRQETPYIVIGCGAAGTGKTFLATSVGLEKLERGEVSKIVLTRPAVCVEGEEHGFLPGTIESKMKPWILPVFDSFQQKIDCFKFEKMIENKQIEIAPLAFMRGRTFENAWIILDEAQNCTVNQMKMVLTRIGNGSKIVITGDPTQHDRQSHDCGLIDLLNRLDNREFDESMISVTQFTEQDVQRHLVIPHVLALYDDQ
jgi:phosphate starvation-inducible PhoH-like protein